MTYIRNRAHEIPTVCYTCSNCENQFEYFSFAHWRTKSGRNFCSLGCKTEFYYLLNQMSKSQLNLLEYLLQNGGQGVLAHNRSLDSLCWKVAPLVTVLYAVNKRESFVEITDMGRRWYQLKVGVSA